MSVQPPYQPAPQKKSRAHVWVLGIGAAIAIISILLCVGGGFSVFSDAKDLVDQPMHHGSHTVQLEEGETTDVYSESQMTSCTATGPNGPVADKGVANETISMGNKELHRAMKIEAQASGDYTITCSDPFVVGEGFSVGGLFLMIASVFGCIIGSILLLVGVVIWALRRR